MNVKSFLASVSLGAILAAIAFLIFFGGYLADFRQDARIDARPHVLPPSPKVAEAPAVIVPCPPAGEGGTPGLRVPNLKPRDEERIRREHGVPAEPEAPAAEDRVAGGGVVAGEGRSGSTEAPGEPAVVIYPLFLTERVILAGEAAHGGRVAAWLNRGGETFLTLKPEPRPFFGFDYRALEVGGAWGGDSAGARWRGWAAWEPVRVGDFRLRLEGGADGRSGSSDAYWLVGATWRLTE